MAYIFDGLKLQKEISESITRRIEDLGRKPKLVIFSSGPSPESLVYIEKKKTFGEKVGCTVEHIELPANIQLKEKKEEIERASKDGAVDGVMVQLPFTPREETFNILSSINTRVDADGLSASNMDALFKGKERILPATTRGILEMLSSYGFSPEKKKVVVVGRSFLVGRPTAMALINRNATVTVCHSNTKDLGSEIRSAELVVSAVGAPGLITSDMLHSEHVIIDVGTSLGEEGDLKGDVDYLSASKIVKAISPVPGGVGPLTVASLFLNLMDLAERRSASE